MDRTLPNFSKTQWAFLAVLAIFDSSIPIETACRLAPLSPGSLLDILKKGKAADLILEYDGNRFSLSDNIHPRSYRKKYERLTRTISLVQWSTILKN